MPWSRTLLPKTRVRLVASATLACVVCTWHVSAKLNIYSKPSCTFKAI